MHKRGVQYPDLMAVEFRRFIRQYVRCMVFFWRFLSQLCLLQDDFESSNVMRGIGASRTFRFQLDPSHTSMEKGGRG